MFSLIITIISIALVVALVAATMYYGGSALNQGTVKADAAGFVASAQQIAVALTLNQVEGHGSIDNLVKSTGFIFAPSYPGFLDNFSIQPIYVSTNFIPKIIDKNYLATIPVVKSGTDNPAGEIATTDNNWMLALQLPAGEDTLAIDLISSVANPEVCLKLRNMGNADNKDKGIFTCEIESNLFRFHLSRQKKWQ